jgi:predicted PurR-regulated permease PerM
MGTDSTSRTLVLLAVLGVIAWCVWLIRDVFPPFLFATALALLLDPTLDRIQRWGVRRGVAIALTFGLFMALFFGVIAFLVPRAVSQVSDLLRNLDTYSLRLQSAVDGWARDYAVQLRKLNLPPSLTEAWQRYQGELSGSFTALLRRLFETLQASAGLLSWLVIVPIVTLYLLIDMDPLQARLCHLVPEQHRAVTVDLCGKVGGVFTAYLRGLTMICASYGLCIYLVLILVFDLRYALILGLLSALLYAVPYVGQIVLIAACCTVAGATGRGVPNIVALALSLAAVGFVFDQAITPRVIGKQVGLHPVLGLFALMVGAQLFGFAGMLVAVPVAASIRVVLVRLFPRLSEPLPVAAAGCAPVPQADPGETGAAPASAAPPAR